MKGDLLGEITFVKILTEEGCFLIMVCIEAKDERIIVFTSVHHMVQNQRQSPLSNPQCHQRMRSWTLSYSLCSIPKETVHTIPEAPHLPRSWCIPYLSDLLCWVETCLWRRLQCHHQPAPEHPWRLTSCRILRYLFRVAFETLQDNVLLCIWPLIQKFWPSDIVRLKSRHEVGSVTASLHFVPRRNCVARIGREGEMRMTKSVLLLT